jgi:thiosulfate reductase cytochrome b subunit
VGKLQDSLINTQTDTNPPDALISPSGARRGRHAGWVKWAHWIVTLSFFVLAFSGVIILMAHPRLYWGETGNDLTPALIELPISRNHRHGGWEKATPFFGDPNSAVSASRTYEIFNKNGWARSLHFLAAWFLIAPGVAYLLGGILTGHFRRRLVPGLRELNPRLLWQDLIKDLGPRSRATTDGLKYGLVQKCTYAGVVFLAVPLVVATGLAMSPTINAGYPWFSEFFGGLQSARTIHFFAFIALILFVLVHVAMVIKSGFKRQMSAMTFGK